MQQGMVYHHIKQKNMSVSACAQARFTPSQECQPPVVATQRPPAVLLWYLQPYSSQSHTLVTFMALLPACRYTGICVSLCQHMDALPL